MTLEPQLDPPDEFRTERLLVRRVRLDDSAALFDAFGGSTDATRFLTWRPKSSADEYRKFIQDVALPGWAEHSAFHWVLQLHDGASAIGMVSMEPGEHGVEVGYVLSPDAWGRGLMTEAAAAPVSWAVREPSVYRVWATCDCENPASARVLEKLEFELEGTLRRWAVHPNVSPHPRDSYCYSRVKKRATST